MWHSIEVISGLQEPFWCIVCNACFLWYRNAKSSLSNFGLAMEWVHNLQQPEAVMEANHNSHISRTSLWLLSSSRNSLQYIVKAMHSSMYGGSSSSLLPGKPNFLQVWHIIFSLHDKTMRAGSRTSKLLCSMRYFPHNMLLFFIVWSPYTSITMLW